MLRPVGSGTGENNDGSFWGSISSLSALVLPGKPASPWNTAIAQSWPLVTQWTPRLEDEYSQFVEHLGQAVAQRRCQRLDRCLRDPAANLLFDPLTDPVLSL